MAVLSRFTLPFSAGYFLPPFLLALAHSGAVPVAVSFTAAGTLLFVLGGLLGENVVGRAAATSSPHTYVFNIIHESLKKESYVCMDGEPPSTLSQFTDGFCSGTQFLACLLMIGLCLDLVHSGSSVPLPCIFDIARIRQALSRNV